MLLELVSSFSVGASLGRVNSQRSDAEEVADAGDHQECPSEVNDGGEEEVAPKIVEFEGRADLREAESRQVTEESTANKRPQHDSPEWEWLTGKVGENHFGGHAAKDKRHRNTEQDQVVIRDERTVWRCEPRGGSAAEHYDRCPFQEDGQNWKILLLASTDNVVDAKWNVSNDQRKDDQTNPDVSHRRFANHLSQPRERVLKEMVNGLGPDFGAVDSRGDHDGASNE